MFQIVPMQPSQLDDVQRVQRQAYPPVLWEDNNALAQKQQLSASTCWVAHNTQGDLVAYILSHPWPKQSIPKLNTVLPNLPDDSELLYIHDVAVHPAWHGQGLAQQLLAGVQKVAVDLALSGMALVAVQGAQPFWRKQGFVTEPHIQTLLHDSLRVYGDDAVYMAANFSRF